MHSLLRRALLFALATGALVIVGCNSCTPGTSLIITGPANDAGYWTSATVGGALVCDGTCTLHTAGAFSLNAAGQQTIPNVYVADGANSYSAFGNNNSCMGSISWSGSYGCPDTLRLPCHPVAASGAHGDATVDGSESETYVSGHPIWDNGTVSVTLDGQTVSASYNRYSTPQSVALDLAAAIENNSTLSAQFASAGLGGDTKLAALNSGSQYDYSWQTSCTHNFLFHSCSFWITLQPSGALTTQ